MKKLALLLLAGALMSPFLTQGATNTPPQFQNVVAVQRPGTMLVDVTYDLIDPDSPWVYVTAQFSTNGGASYFIPFSPLSGDFGPVAPGTGKKMTWNAWNDYPNNFTTNARVQLYGDDSASASGPIPTNAPDGNTNLVYIPSGVFNMSGTLVYISRAFWMSKYPVTQGQYQSIMNTNPSTFRTNLNYPVESVFWSQAVQYCNQLTANERAAGTLPTGWAYRLPTEAEWEYSCRAGTTNTYYFGEDPTHTRLGNYAWFGLNSSGQPHNVGLKAPNRWGLYDMLGNVAEYCSDVYGPLPGGSVTDPQGATSGNTYSTRANGFEDPNPLDFTSATRLNYDFSDGWPPSLRNYDVGFRVVLAQSP